MVFWRNLTQGILALFPQRRCLQYNAPFAKKKNVQSRPQMKMLQSTVVRSTFARKNATGILIIGIMLNELNRFLPLPT